MKKFLLFALCFPLLFSCNKSSSPKETAQIFLKALSASDLATASDLVSTGTKKLLTKAKKENLSIQKPDECFQFTTLTETVLENKAEVRNEVISIPLIKEDNGWKVMLDETLINNIQGREEALAQVKTRWEALLQAYEARQLVLKEYINYKKSMGALSPKMMALNSAVSSFLPQKEWTKKTLQAYVQKQLALNKIIDEGLEPSTAANTDLTLNYFLQISNAGDQIKAAETDYQAMAEKVHSPVFAALPVKSNTVIQVSH